MGPGTSEIRFCGEFVCACVYGTFVQMCFGCVGNSKTRYEDYTRMHATHTNERRVQSLRALLSIETITH